MSDRGVELYILDIFIAIDKIKRYTLKFSNGNDLLCDELSWDATIRELEVIGEATKSLLQNNILNDKKYRRIVDFRNQINHGYFGIDEDIVWDVVTNKLNEYESDLFQVTVELKLEMKNVIEIFKQENIKHTKVLLFLEKFENRYR
ncbi:MAG: hypothetical protein QG559_1028 [Campylobacterota bacterium]|nr:hypothetical protein [Campylobacterota bacterium]